MSSAPTYPGVYIREVPSGVRAIIGVATSVAAFVDFFDRGPMDRAIQIFSMGDFEREFGGLDTRSEASYAIRQFFLNGGGAAWVVRAASGSFAAASVTLKDAKGNETLRATTGRRIKGKSVEDPGMWGNGLRVRVDHEAASSDFFSLEVSEIARANGRRVVRRRESFPNLTMTSGERNAVEVVNEGSTLIQLSRDPSWSGNLPAPTGTTGGDLSAAAAVDKGDTLKLECGGNSYDLTFEETATTPREKRSALQAALRAAAPNEPCLARAAVQLVDDGTAGQRLRVVAGPPAGQGEESVIFSFSEDGGSAGAALGLVGPGVTANVQEYALGSTTDVGQHQGAGTPGTDGTEPDDNALRGVRDPDKSGLYALEDVDLFNILCLPRASELSTTKMNDLLGVASAYCEERRAFLLVDPPPGVNSMQEARDWIEDNAVLRNQNSAVYFPRIRIADPLNGSRLRPVGPSGTIAGLYARTDATRGVWKAPAGIEAGLRNVQDLEYELTDPENGQLNPLGINCLRRFDVPGNVCWGARTLFGADLQASEWKYVPVRRLALFLEESLYRGTQWVVFEPNDEPLWSQIRLNVGAFMHDLFRQGAFQGKTARDTYFVQCDGETTTTTDVDRGIVNIRVGFAPLKPAEFVIIEIQQIAGQIQA